MGSVIDIDSSRPHITAELICIFCKKRWIAVFPEDSILAEWDCPYCGKNGGVICTGQHLLEGAGR